MIMLFEWYISWKEKREGYLNIIIVQCGILWHQWTSPAKAISEATPAGWKTLPFDVFNHSPAFVSLSQSLQVDSLWITCFSLFEKTSFERKTYCWVSACLLSLALVLSPYRESHGPTSVAKGVERRRSQTVPFNCSKARAAGIVWCSAASRHTIAFIDGDWLADGVIHVAWQADPCLQPKNRLSFMS